MAHPDLVGIATGAEARERRLRTFCARVEEDDAGMVAAWRARSPAEPGVAGAQLSDLAARIAVQAGLGKDARLSFPSLFDLRRRRTA